MLHIIPALKGGAVMLGAVGSFFSMALLAETNIGDSTNIQIGLVCGLVVVVFFAGAFLQRIKDGQKAANKRLSRIERKLKISEDPDNENEND